jgi:hypothetical protein
MYLYNNDKYSSEDGFYWITLFAISTKNGYRWTSVDGFKISISSFIDLKSDGKCQIIIGKIITKHPKVNVYFPREINFYLFHLLVIGGDEPRIADELDPRFPKIISYIWAPDQENHKETKLLSPLEKKDLILKYQPLINKY